MDFIKSICEYINLRASAKVERFKSWEVGETFQGLKVLEELKGLEDKFEYRENDGGRKPLMH